jgi:hypothetical protein
VLSAISIGASLEDAALAAGICRRTLSRWRTRGRRAAKGKWARFWADVEKAEAQCLVRNLAIIQQAAGGKIVGTWQAAAWKLERLRPDRYGIRERHELTGKGGGPMQFSLFEVLKAAEAKEKLKRDE